MDGKTLLYGLRQLLEEDSSSGFIDDYSSYMFLWEAAIDFATKTKCLRTYQDITSVADQAAYDLNSDYMGFYIKNSDKDYIVKYYDTSDYTFIKEIPYEELFYNNNATSVTIPSGFSIIDNPDLPDQVTGTATSDGDASGGESTLTDSAADYSDVTAGDDIHNTTDVSSGVVLAVSTTLTVALFNGTDNEWDTDDAYVIQPQGRNQIVLDPPPSTAGHTITVPYLQRPAPVYSDYGLYRFPKQYSAALVKYAAWLYKYRDKEPNYGDKWFAYYTAQVKQYSNQVDHILRRKTFTVSFKK